MIDPALYVSFVVVATAVIVTPGPNVLTIVATSIALGRRRGLTTMAGTLAAMAIQLLVAVKSTVLLAETLSELFWLIKWVGAAYLVYLGGRRLLAAVGSRRQDKDRGGSNLGSFCRGFLIGITNPKTILFFGAFLPQFTSAARPLEPQLALLSGTFLLLALIFDGTYALAAAKLSDLARSARFGRGLDAAAGTLFVGAGLGLAAARRMSP